MSPIVQAAIDSMLAELTPSGLTPTGNLGYGRDLACTTDCDRMFSEVDPSSSEGIAQALIRRLITPRGSLIGSALRGSADLDRAAKDYGLDVRGYLNRGITQDDLAMVGAEIALECQKDERVSAVQVDLTLTGNRLRIALEVEPYSQRTFRFVFALTDTDLLVEAMQ